MNDEQREKLKRFADEGRRFATAQTKIYLVEGEPIDPEDPDQVIAVMLSFIALLIDQDSEIDKVLYGDPSQPAPVGILHSNALKKA